MNINTLNVTNFRNIQQAKLELAPKVNTIVGNNGSGKTSLLEAIYYLGHAKSFRTPHSNQLINFKASEFILYGELNDSKTIGIQKTSNSEQIKITRQPIQKKSDLVKTFPIQFIDPSVHKILEDSPRHRRRFLDWGVFHVEHSFLDHWRKYQGILKQRNAALKKRWDKQLIDSWNEELVAETAAITQIRNTYVQDLISEFKQIQGGFEGAELNYQQGWPDAHPFIECLEKSYALDCKTGFTKYGPHRCDIRITLNGIPAKDVVSRGQQKYLACLLKIAQVSLFKKRLGRVPLMLVDDIFSEFDRHSVKNISDLLLAIDCQLVLTGTEQRLIEATVSSGQMKMFHVEHGLFKEVV